MPKEEEKKMDCQNVSVTCKFIQIHISEICEICKVENVDLKIELNEKLFIELILDQVNKVIRRR